MHTSSFMKCSTLRGNLQLTLVRALCYANPLGSKNYYKTLELKKNCSEKEVREAYIRLSKEHHPDKNPNAMKCEKKFIDINEAYSVLSKPATRRRYDDYLSNFDSSDKPFTSSYEELTHRYNQYNSNRYQWKARGSKDEIPLHKLLFVVVGAMFFIGILEFQIVKKVAQAPDEMIDGIPIFHTKMPGADVSKMNEYEAEAYDSAKRRIITNTVKLMKAENDSRLRDQDRLRSMLDNGAHREKSEH